MKITVQRLRALIRECINEDTDWDAEDAHVNKPKISCVSCGASIEKPQSDGSRLCDDCIDLYDDDPSKAPNAAEKQAEKDDAAYDAWRDRIDDSV